MPGPELLLAFVAATVVLMLIPGPNVALIVANSVAHGTRFGLLTVAGTATGVVPQLVLVGLGMAGLLDLAGHWFAWLRWIGAAYLIVLGVRQWRAPAPDLSAVKPQRRSARVIYVQAALISLTNPKTLMFIGAFFPQFVVATAPAAQQVVLLAMTFLLVALTIDSLWATLAGHLAPWLAARGRWRQRVTGGLLVTAGAGLAFARPR